jgi:hypothetical protein
VFVSKGIRPTDFLQVMKTYARLDAMGRSAEAAHQDRLGKI